MNKILESKTWTNLRGEQLIGTLKQIKTGDFPNIVSGELLTDEFGNSKIWRTFILFNEKLSEVFRGSYISPQRFLKELGITDDETINKQQNDILSKKLGTINDPTFSYSCEAKNSQKFKFSISVLNGALNEHSLEMTRLAREANDLQKNTIESDENRALYQYHMHESIKENISDQSKPEIGVIFSDDCLASADSAIGKIMELVKNKDPRINHGITINSTTASVQSVLYLKRFCELLGIDLKINVGQLAFGLTNGSPNENTGRLEHAYYITYPQELLKLLSQYEDNSKIVEQLQQCEVMLKGEKMIQTVGDMGVLQEGIKKENMDIIREKYKTVYGSDFCWWNETREDSHGQHLKTGLLKVFKYGEGDVLSVYFARGAYLFYEWERKTKHYFDEIEVNIERASRLCTEEHGYGLGIDNCQ
jgi:hypothetical protein